MPPAQHLDDSDFSQRRFRQRVKPERRDKNAFRSGRHRTKRPRLKHGVTVVERQAGVRVAENILTAISIQTIELLI